MAGINVPRWLAGGLAAGIVLWLLEGLASGFYRTEMEAALAAMGLTVEMGPSAFVLSILVSLIVGTTGVFFYAAARPRFGPGPGTAVIVGVALWLGAYLTSLLGYQLLGMFPPTLLVAWGVLGLVEMVVAMLVGGWVYREG